MLKMLGRLYLIMLMTYGAALYVIPELVLKLFDHRAESYNLEQERGTLALVRERFEREPEAAWPALANTLQDSFAPLHVRLVDISDPGLTEVERSALLTGKNVVRNGYYGTLGSALTALNDHQAIELATPAPPIDINMIYWSMNILIGAALLGCLLLWVKPHWRDLQRLKRTAMLLGQGQLSVRTQIAPSSNIGELAQVFDTMAEDVENLLTQQQDLLNAVSHELRTPLARLEFGMAIVLSDQLPAATQARLEQMVGHIRELDTLIDELLSYNRLQMPRQPADIQQVPLQAYLDSVVGAFVAERDESPFALTLTVQTPFSGFALDPRLTARALQNLIGNAIRYCGDQVTITARSTVESGLEIAVEDDGIGVPESERQRIFEPFYRMDRSRDRMTGGFGLGLAISKRAIESQRGELYVEPSQLGGARFVIVLPVTAPVPPTKEMDLRAQ